MFFRKSLGLMVVSLLALPLLACGTTEEGEKRQQTAFGTFIEVETQIALPDGTLVPFKIEWDTGTDKGLVDIRAYSPSCLVDSDANVRNDACLLFWYHAENVSHVESVLDTLVKVKAEIAKQQIALGADVAKALIRGITAAVLPLSLSRPGQ